MGSPQPLLVPHVAIVERGLEGSANVVRFVVTATSAEGGFRLGEIED